ncbi:M20/M25/M40 family metallo-hydrolase [Planctomyces sp. SH-PL62]|uniref:M20/M25/M40 family metallo-hydrolase n=1 Tax=Planctomyces sp. SH-PL62 TaxID=1636152 RepID=UPI00078BE437|nr:M20/M25/M40 family metallo-hydrolase [Planctomyces sp. SH-PL62]AMV37606.1 Leupeptin-inactivating enzyme 1 precursor [Planctomyces sp. SH-PL62]
MKIHLLALTLLAPVAARAQAPVDSAAVEPPPAAVASITGREIGGHLQFLASDLMRGRDAASPEARLTAEYLASHLTAVGAEPLGDPGRGGRTFLQRFPLEVATPLSEGSGLTLTLAPDASKRVVACKLGVDYIYGPQGVAEGEVDAQVVFAGYGRHLPDQGIDDYAGLDVRNRFVLIYEGAPGNARSDPGEKRELAVARGALGLLVIPPPDVAGASRPLGSPSAYGFDRSQMTLGRPSSSIPTITLSSSIRDLLVSALQLGAGEEAAPMQFGSEFRARFAHAVKREPREDRNVIGFLPGSDPVKKNELVVFSAHYDHVGVDDKGEIHNGSDDNASGTSGLLEIAQAFAAAPRPARSVAFLWVSAEEKGLLGSKWFADHQALPEGGKIVADINLDMISRNDPTKIGATPSPSHPDYNTLVTDAAVAAQAEGLEILYDSDPYYGRTDSYNFAAKGIPVIFFFAGLHEDYHKPSDDVEKADLEKAARVARAAFRLGWKTAQAPEPPKKITAPPAANP